MGTIASRFLLLAAAVCIVVAVVALYARSAILDRGQFADRAVAALAQDEVDEEIALRFTDGVVERSPGLVTLRPALEQAAADVAAGPWFAAEFGVGMRALHDRVFTTADARPSLRVPGMAAQVRAALGSRTPVLATRLPGDANPSLLSIGGSPRERALLAAARRADGPTRLAPIALVLGLLCLLLGALGASDRRRGIWTGGLALAAAGGALGAGWLAARTLTLERFDTSWGDAVVRTIWGDYLGDLRVWSLGLAGVGIVIAAVARPERARRPALSDLPRAVRGIALIVAGGILLADRDLALDLAAVTGAGVLLYLGACRLLAGRARLALAGAALAALAAGVAVAVSGPAPAPHVVTAAKASPRPGPSGSPARRARAAEPRICFASIGDARAAAEGAAIPEGAVVRQLADGRVCVRSR